MSLLVSGQWNLFVIFPRDHILMRQPASEVLRNFSNLLHSESSVIFEVSFLALIFSP